MGAVNEASDIGVPRCLVVMCHYVRPKFALGRLPQDSVRGRIDGLSVADFEAQLDRLCAKYEPIDWPMLCAWRDGRRELPPRSFLLTFDDGLSDHARYVAPVLHHRGLRGVFFVPGVVLAEQCMLSAHMIHLLIAGLGDMRLRELIMEQLRGRGDVDPNWLADTSWHEASDRLYHYETTARGRLKYLLTMRLPLATRHQILRDLFETHVGSARRWSRDWYLSWDDVVALQSAGHTVGGHGYAHEPLERLTEAEQAKDIRRVSDLFEDAFGRTFRPFSYPYGRVSSCTPALCRESGFVDAFTTQARWLSANDHRFLCPRVDTIHVDQFIEQEPACHVAR